MKRKLLFTVLLIADFTLAFGASNTVHSYYPPENTMLASADYPIIVMPAPENDQMPLVFVITGDGGWKGLDQKLSTNFVKEGAPVVALNALKYFWSKKTPDETAKAVSDLLTKYMQQWHKQNFILVGFSFGADVMPFIYNRLPADLADKAKLIALLSPGRSTDFEIHISQMLSTKHDYADKVAPEISKIDSIPLLCFFGDEEHDFPTEELPKKNCEVVILKGGHHYEEDKSDLAKIILKHAGGL